MPNINFPRQLAWKLSQHCFNFHLPGDISCAKSEAHEFETFFILIQAGIAKSSSLPDQNSDHKSTTLNQHKPQVTALFMKHYRTNVWLKATKPLQLLIPVQFHTLQTIPHQTCSAVCMYIQQLHQKGINCQCTETDSACASDLISLYNYSQFTCHTTCKSKEIQRWN